jgi:hypothetical protein
MTTSYLRMLTTLGITLGYNKKQEIDAKVAAHAKDR